MATGFGPVGSIQRQASYIGQAGMAPEFTAMGGVANLTAEAAAWASLGLGAYRAGKITLELIQAARALPGEGNLITKIGRLLQNQSASQNAEEVVTWVDEGGNLRTGGSPGMRPDAYDFQSGAPGARSNPLTGRGQAPYLQFKDETGRVIGAKFDGVRGTELIDRKLNPVFSPKAVDQASRQIAVAKHFGLQVVWEMPNQSAVDAALRFLQTNKISGITVRLAK